MFLINGIWQTQLPASDRAVQFGDGCFTTARIINGQVRFLDQHITRLQAACQRLGIPFSNTQVLREEMNQVAGEVQNAVLKVIVSRGTGGRGYNPVGCLSPSRILSVSPMPGFYSDWKKEGVALSLSPIQLGINPALAGIKHLNRLEQVMIRAHIEQTMAQETIVLDSDGMMVECCAANLFWRHGKQVFTPSVALAGVNGTMRQHIIATLSARGINVQEIRASPEVLAQADEVFICNALMPIIPVRQAPGATYTSRELFTCLAPQCE